MCEGGLVIEARPLASIRGPVDTLVVVGGLGFDEAAADPELLRHVARLARRARRVASVCSGAFVLAAAGLLDGRTATTHWAVASYLADRHPPITVEPDRIYVRDGDVWSSAGVTAGIDLTLALVADDLGEELAHLVARWLVLPVRRSGGQSQYSVQLASTERRLGHASPRCSSGWRPTSTPTCRWRPSPSGSGGASATSPVASPPRPGARRAVTSRTCASTPPASCSRPPGVGIEVVARRCGFAESGGAAPGVPAPSRHHAGPVPPQLRVRSDGTHSSAAEQNT